ncbi:hypothetical protein BJ322DRAFT_1099100 [Thelephora terrestris]|uniref:RRM domain-containing protein n=1 Tax=Thelephora terrestris TaxID=56493 RepID=A0A9P6HK59_9AGAM|nr:hypothetical protein BJ322DRAFT_1099100 [Thelephora terrestris]
MDKTLEDIITSRPKPGRRAGSRRGVARAEVLGKKDPAPSVRARYTTTTPGVGKTTPATAQGGEKIIVSNLPTDVNEAQIKELFHSTIGPLKDVALHYDPSGRSKGVANILFQRKGDGTKAYQQYNNRLIDGKRPMKIEIVVDPVNLPGQSLASRVAPAPTTNGTADAPRRGAPRRGRGRGARRRNERPNKSAADLDAEMEDYTAASSTPAAPTNSAPATATTA